MLWNLPIEAESFSRDDLYQDKRNERNGIMNKDQVEGRVESAKGSVKETAGKVVGNDRLASEGAADKAAGKVQATVGDAKEKLGDALKKAVDR